MKLYYFMIIAIGLMFTFNLAGIDTGNHNILVHLGFENNNISNLSGVELKPDIGNISIESSDIARPSNLKSKIKHITDDATLWWSFAVAMAVIFGLAIAGSIRIAGSGFNTSAGIYVITAGVSIFIFYMFAFDFLSILRYMKEITGGTGWEYYLVWILIFPFIVGFAFELIKFIQGTD